MQSVSMMFPRVIKCVGVKITEFPRADAPRDHESLNHGRNPPPQLYSDPTTTFCHMREPFDIKLSSMTRANRFKLRCGCFTHAVTYTVRN